MGSGETTLGRLRTKKRIGTGIDVGLCCQTLPVTIKESAADSQEVLLATRRNVCEHQDQIGMLEGDAANAVVE